MDMLKLQIVLELAQNSDGFSSVSVVHWQGQEHNKTQNPGRAHAFAGVISLAVEEHFTSRNPNGCATVDGSYIAPSGNTPRKGEVVLMWNPHGVTVVFALP